MTAEPWLVADVGGTGTRVALAGETGILPDSVRRYANARAGGLAALLGTYLDEAACGPVGALCAGVAGPVRDGTAQLTNHDWFIDAAVLARATGAGRVHLLNDLQAHGHALDDLPPGTVTGLVPGTPAADAPRLVLNLGTGCNIAVVHRVGRSLFVPPSESGHTTLPDDPALRPVLDRLRADHPHLPVEAALSGPGLSNLHQALTGSRLAPGDILAGNHRGTLTAFARLLGHVAGNLCLAQMAAGGLFLTGGMARAVAPHLDLAEFRDAFIARGPYTGIVAAIPVSLVSDDMAALRGCARYLRQETP